MKRWFSLLIFLVSFGVAAVDGKHHLVRSPGKLQAPIELEYQPFTKPLVAGQRVQLDLRFKVGQNIDRLSVETNSSNSIASMQKQATRLLKVAPNGLSDAMSVDMTPVKDGIYYVNVIASVEVAGQKQFRTFAIPVIVGKADWNAYLKPDGDLTQDHNGRRILVQPAHETIQD